MASRVGVVQDYLKTSAYADNFKGLEVNSAEFIAEWKRLAGDDPGFGVDQHDYVQKTHYSPSFQSLKRNGIDLDSRGEAFKDMVWSTSVQYGPGSSTMSVISRGLKEAYGDDYKIDDLSDAQVVTAVQDSKLRHVAGDFRSSMKSTPGIETRIDAEKFALTHLAETGNPLPMSEIAAYQRSVQPLQVGMRGDAVAAMQRDLGDLGYLSRSGLAPDPDGHFGRGTEEALKSFQQTEGLVRHGEGSVLTLQRLHEQARSRDVGMETIRAQSASMPQCRLDDPAHPDHRMFVATRALVRDLDRSHGRSPDDRSDNLAASLVVAARQSGLERIDQIALSDDASKLWGVQRPAGVRDHFFDRQANTDTVQALNTSISESSNRWPDAMQAYEAVRQGEQQMRQQTLDQQQTQTQNGPSMSLGR
jgi:peptidoglycan hydrolase-like protein with peptidoglycan-binding domain